jgi:predicted lipid-binding transport protein (Tim44 family)
MGSQYVDVVVFALVAIFIALRLRSVLGRRTGNERPPPQFGPTGGPLNGSSGGSVGGGNVTPLRPGASSSFGGPIVEGRAVPVPAADPHLASIQAIDPSITADTFVGGARAAFAMILQAFAHGEEAALRPLLSDEVYENFARVIHNRRDAGETCENQLVNIVSAEIVEGEMVGRDAHVTVRFTSHQIIVVKDAQGAVVEGDPAKTVQLVDVWTFSRDPRSRNPNWTLIATRSE